MAGGRGTRLLPITLGTSKQLLHIYDQPLIRYSVATQMLAGSKEILLIVSNKHLEQFKEILGDGHHLGICIENAIQENPLGIPDGLILASGFINKGEGFVLTLGDNFFHGPFFGSSLQGFRSNIGATILAAEVSRPNDYAVVETSRSGKVMSIEEKLTKPKSKLAVPGIYFLDESAPDIAKSLTFSSRGELEIVDLLTTYMNSQQLNVQVVPRGNTWMDAGSF